LWGGHSCPPFLTLVLIVHPWSSAEVEEGKTNPKGGGQECPPHTSV